MSSFIRINNLNILAYHGVLDQERTVGHNYRIDCILEVDIQQAMVSDDVRDTVNYAEVVQTIQEEMRQPSHLLEHVAGRIIQALQHRWPHIKGIDLSIAKLCPPIPNANVESCAVRIQI